MPLVNVLQWQHRVWFSYSMGMFFSTLRTRQNGRHFADDNFKCFFVKENIWISIKISLRFVPKRPIKNNPALVQIMAWRRPGDKPLSETMMVSLPTHICVTRPQWVNQRRSPQDMTMLTNLFMIAWCWIQILEDFLVFTYASFIALISSRRYSYLISVIMYYLAVHCIPIFLCVCPFLLLHCLTSRSLC